MNLCIFLQSGRTFTFQNVKIVHNNEGVLEFSYTAMSDGKNKVAVFLKPHIAGWSASES